MVDLGMIAGMLLGLASAATSEPTGWSRTITTVRASPAVRVLILGAIVCPRAERRIHRPSDATTSAAVSGRPVWKITSGRSRIVSVRLLLDQVEPAARRGWGAQAAARAKGGSENSCVNCSAITEVGVWL